LPPELAVIVTTARNMPFCGIKVKMEDIAFGTQIME